MLAGFGRVRLRRGSVAAFVLLMSTACSGAQTGPEVGPTAGPDGRPTAAPTPAPTVQPTLAAAQPSVAAAPGTPGADTRTVVGQPGRGGMRTLLPLAGEFAVTANLDDRSLSVVPIGAAVVAATVALDVAPRAVGAAPNSDMAFAADGAPAAHDLALASLNASAEAGSIDVGGQPERIVAPPPSGPAAPLLVIDGDANTVRPLDLASRTLGPGVGVGLGPHAASVARGGTGLGTQVLVANGGDGTISVLDSQATAVQATLAVGGRPVGVARTVDGRLWVADGQAGTLAMLDAESGRTLQTITVGPHLTGLAATPDAHFLVLSSSDPDAALYVVDLLGQTTARDAQTVRHLAVPGVVLALATGAEVARAYATTGDGHLVYWDLTANAITQSIAVGRNPVGLALGSVAPSGALASTSAGTPAAGAAGAAGETATGGGVGPTGLGGGASGAPPQAPATTAPAIANLPPPPTPASTTSGAGATAPISATSTTSNVPAGTTGAQSPSSTAAPPATVAPSAPSAPGPASIAPPGAPAAPPP